jgi:hypothetical protein
VLVHALRTRPGVLSVMNELKPRADTQLQISVNILHSSDGLCQQKALATWLCDAVNRTGPSATPDSACVQHARTLCVGHDHNITLLLMSATGLRASSDRDRQSPRTHWQDVDVADGAELHARQLKQCHHQQQPSRMSPRQEIAHAYTSQSQFVGNSRARERHLLAGALFPPDPRPAHASAPRPLEV